MQLPVTNAALTRVEGGGTTEDYEQAAGTAVTKFTGSVPAYVVLTESVRSEPDGRNRRKRSFIVVPFETTGLLELDDTLTFTYEGETLQRPVREILPHKVAGTTRVYLEDE